MTDDQLWRLDATDLTRLIRLGRASAREAMESVLARWQGTHAAINAVVLVRPEAALAAADAADAARRRGEALGPLHGVPVTVKINTDVKGEPTDNGAAAYRDLIAPADSPLVANLRRAGAIPFGRSNAPTFSMRWFTDNALHGRTLNPWQPARTPGGSSGGAGAAVAAGVGPIAQGNDIGGSVRYPAYCCGVAGLRPSYGRVPAWNATASKPRRIAGQLMAVQGPLARSVRDLALALAAMAGDGGGDPRWVPAPLAGPPLPRPIRVAYCEAPDGLAARPAVRTAMQRAASALEDAGYAVEAVEPPGMARLTELWKTLIMDDVIDPLLPVVEQVGDPATRQSMALFRAAWPRGGMERMLSALAARDSLAHDWELFLARYPVVLLPVSAEPALPVDLDLTPEGIQRLMAAQAPQMALSALPVPVLVVPSAVVDGLPVGPQIIGPRFREDIVLTAGEVIEAACGAVTPIDPRPA